LEVLIGYHDDLATEIHPGSVTASGACSLRSVRRWNRSWATKSVTRRCRNCCRSAAARPGYARPADANCPRWSPAAPPRMGTRLVEVVLTALDEQTVTVPDTAAAETVLPRLADSLRQVPHQRDQVAAEVERILDATLLPGFRCPASASGPAQTTQAGVLPRRLRVAVPPAVEGLLRPETNRGQEGIPPLRVGVVRAVTAGVFTRYRAPFLQFSASCDWHDRLLTRVRYSAEELSRAAATVVYFGGIGSNARPHQIAQLFARGRRVSSPARGAPGLGARAPLCREATPSAGRRPHPPGAGHS
jgi:hypothetical protein